MSQSQNQGETSPQYNVVFCGELAEGFSPGEVKQKLMKMFNVPEQLIEGAYAGKPLLVKDSVDLQTAQQYKNIFEKAGTICRIEAVKPAQRKIPGTPVQQPERQNIISSRNGAIEITKPEDWDVNENEGDASVQIVNRQADLCMTFLSERKTEFNQSLDYMDFAQKACDSILAKDSSYQKISGPVGLFINRMRGVRYEISGKPGAKRLKTLQVVLDGEQYFLMCIATATENIYNSKKPIFEEILLTFCERGV